MEGESSTENESPPRKEISRGGGAPSPLSLFSRDANENEEDEFNVIHLPPSPPPSPPAITPNITLRRKRTSIASHCVNLPTPRGTSLIRQASKACGGSFKNLHSASGSLENSISGIHDESILEEGGREGQFEADVEEGKEVKKEDGHITPSGPLLFEHFIVVGAPETVKFKHRLCTPDFLLIDSI